MPYSKNPRAPWVPEYLAKWEAALEHIRSTNQPFLIKARDRREVQRIQARLYAARRSLLADPFHPRQILFSLSTSVRADGKTLSIQPDRRLVQVTTKRFVDTSPIELPPLPTLDEILGQD